jgi:hypothetical protein
MGMMDGMTTGITKYSFLSVQLNTAIIRNELLFLQEFFIFYSLFKLMSKNALGLNDLFTKIDLPLNAVIRSRRILKNTIPMASITANRFR